jgi:predicted ferric reductase
MSTVDNIHPNRPQMSPSGRSSYSLVIKILGGVALVAGFIVLAMIGLLLSVSPIGQGVNGVTSWLLALNTNQTMWYITRAAGITSYLLLWLSTAWGLAVANRILDGKLHGSYTYDFHQFISLLAIGFMGLHIIVLLFDQYLPYNIAQILVPFLSPYRPVWVGIGVLSLYITLLVTITFYIRDRIGSRAFRTIHVFSLLAFLGAAIHGLFAGTDSPLLVVQWMYGFTFLSIVFLLTYWVVALVLKKRRAKQPLTY